MYVQEQGQSSAVHMAIPENAEFIFIGPSDQRGLVVSTLTSLYPNLPWNDKPAESRVVFEVFLSREQSLVTSEEWNLVGMMALHLSRDEQTKVIGLASQAVSEFKSISSAAIKGLLPLSVSEHSEVTHAEIDHLLSQVVTGSDEALLQAVVGYLQYPSCLVSPNFKLQILRTMYAYQKLDSRDIYGNPANHTWGGRTSRTAGMGLSWYNANAGRCRLESQSVAAYFRVLC